MRPYDLAMRIDTGLIAGIDKGAEAVQEAARTAEGLGYDGVFTAETSHDPFFPLALAASATTQIELATGIAVAFARSPMTTAQTANDLHLLSGGRFILGLGSQIQPHITKRFSMPWGQPAARMREYVMALRAIWDCWNNGTKLDFRGDFYTHTLMTPFFNPGPNPYGTPKVLIAAVGPAMTEVAAEVGDGVMIHGFTTPRYFAEVTEPAIERGLARAGKSRADFTISYPAFVVTGETEQDMAKAAAAVRGQIGFYGSTPAYKPVLDIHGWGDLSSELNRLSKSGQWADMATLLSDDLLAEFAVVGPVDEVGRSLAKRWGDKVDRVNFYAPYAMHANTWVDVANQVRSSVA